MAKKEVVKLEQDVVAVAKPLVIEDTANTKISEMSLMELVYAEKAARVVCQKYENTVKNYDGSFVQNGVEYNTFRTFNNLRNKIILKLEEKLKELI